MKHFSQAKAEMEDSFLITGSTGFVGSNLTRFLISKNKKVTVIVRDGKLNWRLRDIASELSIYESDLLSNSLPKIIKKIRPTVIFHLATYGGLPEETDTNRMIDVNIKGTLNLVNAVKENKFKLFINTGSSSEYGIKEKSMKESDLSIPINDYGVTKAAATMLCSKIAKSEKLPIITYRLFSPYGYYEERTRLIPSIILNILNNKPVNLSSPTNVRDFIFIEDVISAYLKAVNHIFNQGEIFNIGSGKQHNINEVVNTVLQITKNSPKIAWGTVKKQSRQVEPKSWKADITKVKKEMKWYPNNNFHDGLLKTVSWFRENINLYEK